jgi:hypothetical protein
VVDRDPVTSFAAAWHRSFLLAPPVSYRMRELYPARWLRIHSLPESKRYPESPEEHAEVLARHNAVATAMFGEAREVALVVEQYGTAEAPAPPPDLPDGLGGGLRPLRRVDPRELQPEADPADDAFVDLSAAAVIWRPGALDALISELANGEGSRFLLSTLDAARVYAPYDGGADLFLEDRGTRDEWKARFSAWLSRDPSGL